MRFNTPRANRMSISRWRASFIHLVLSIFVACSIVAIMLLLWYPTPYFQAMGGHGLILILVGVDVVLGPLITLIIFDVNKKSLRFDLTCIALVQLSALAYGVYTVFEARPIYSVYYKGRFDVVTAADVDPLEHKKVANPKFKSFPLSGPMIAAVDMPVDPQERERILFSAIGGADLPRFTQHYLDYDARAKEAGERSRPIAELESLSAEAKRQVSAFFANTPIDATAVGYLPLRARSKDMVVVVQRADGKIIGIIPVDPWQLQK
jgi:hypothetical protein